MIKMMKLKLKWFRILKMEVAKEISDILSSENSRDEWFT